MRIRPVFAWYDLWVGAYWDRRARRLYVLPLPCIGVAIEFVRPQPSLDDIVTTTLRIHPDLTVNELVDMIRRIEAERRS